MEKDERLEFLSDQVRKGEPISVHDAIAVIKYQEALREEREIKKIPYGIDLLTSGGG